MPVWSPALFFSSTSEEAYVIQDSVMLDGSADYMTLTPPYGGSRYKYTISTWVKSGNLGLSNTGILSGDSTGAGFLRLSSDAIDFGENGGTQQIVSTAKFRDPTAWFHVVASWDSGNATTNDRMIVYVNGARIATADLATNSQPSQGTASSINQANLPFNIGAVSDAGPGQFWSGYLAETIFLDGLVLTPTAFGEYNDEGIWIPKDPSDTDNIADWGGNNSSWLKYADATNLGFNSRPTALTANAGTYKIDNSLWLDGSADYLYRTPSSGSASTKYTLSIWFKRGTFSEQYLFMQGSDASNLDVIEFTSDHRLQIRWYPNTVAADLITTQVFRDPSAWQHLVISVDTTLGVAGNRIKIYVNGVRVTAFDTQSNPSSSATSMIGGTSQMTIGRKTPGTTWYYPGYLAEYIFLDGYAGTATDFGGWDANGDWLPVDPTTVVTNNKGTNGFHLDFALAQGDGNGPGNDISGNNNDFTNVSLTAAQTTTDSPTNTAGDNEGNYATLNPLSKSSGGATTATISEGNTRWLRPNDGSNNQQCYATFGADEGKFYFEFKLLQANNGFDTGLFAEGEINGNEGAGFSGYDVQGYYLENYGTGVVWKVTTADGSGSGSRTDTGDSCTANDVMKIAVDFDAGKIWLGNVTQDTYYNSSGADVAFNTSTPTFTFTANTRLFPYIFGHAQVNEAKFRFLPAEWTGSAPTGFEPWNTSELAAPTVTDPRKYWSNTLYVGSAAIRSVRQCFDSTGTAWTPDFVWIKNRTGTVASHHLYDVVRGVNKFIKPNNTDAQDSSRTDMLTSFDSGGFSLGVDASEEAINKNNDTYVAWCMKAGGAASSNSNGSITTSVSAADHGGFSIATWTGNGSAGATIGHGLSRKPAMGIFRRLSLAQDWAVYHEALDASAPEDKYLNLNLNDAAGDATWLNDTPPSASIWTLGTSGYVNTSSETFVAYSFARTPGLIGIGSYIANADADGPNIIIDDGASGFRPAFILVKNADASSRYWVMLDSARNTFNPVQNALIASETLTEATGYFVDFTANGFKIRVGGGTQLNTGSDKHIYLAFADEPFNLARAR